MLKLDTTAKLMPFIAEHMWTPKDVKTDDRFTWKSVDPYGCWPTVRPSGRLPLIAEKWYVDHDSSDINYEHDYWSALVSVWFTGPECASDPKTVTVYANIEFDCNINKKMIEEVLSLELESPCDEDNAVEVEDKLLVIVRDICKRLAGTSLEEDIETFVECMLEYKFDLLRHDVWVSSDDQARPIGIDISDQWNQ